MNLALRNTHAMRSAQVAFDNRLPDEDDGRAEYIAEQAGKLLGAEDSDLVPFLTRTCPYFEAGFDEVGTEAICTANDHEAPLLQLVLAVRDGKHELAEKLVKRFDSVLCEAAEKLIKKALEGKP